MKSKIILVLSFCIVSLCNAQVYTPNGTEVQVEYRAELLTDYEIEQYNEYCETQFPFAQILGPATTTYNCHSYAWNLAQGGNQVCWMNEPDVYWADGSYEETSEANAQIIYYESDYHSAIKSYYQPGMYISKWGSLPLMQHYPEDCPYPFSYDRRYYRLASISQDVNFINKTVTTNTTVPSSGDINVQNVSVQNGAKLTLDADENVKINGVFEVELGSRFETVLP